MFQRAEIDSKCRSPAKGSIRTIPKLIEFNARNNPDYLFCQQAQKPAENLDSPFELLDITYHQLKCAILRCEDWLVENINGLQLPHINDQGGVTKGSPVALLMGSDVGLLFHMFALLGLGVPVILLSARLTPAAIYSLMRENSVFALLASPNLGLAAKKAVSLFGASRSLPSVYTQIPYQFFLQDQSSYTDRNVFVEQHYISDDDRNVFILHSSGTTGLPKSICCSHRYLLGYSTCHDFPVESEAQGMNITTLPLYHGWGLVPICVSLSIGKTICLPVPSNIPTGSSIMKLLNISQARSLMTVPSTLEEIVELPDKEGINVLRRLDFIACGGGPLNPSTAEDLVNDGVKIVNSYGITETGPLSLLHVPRPGYDWQYFRLRKDIDAEIHTVSNSQPDQQLRCRLAIHPAGWETIFEPGDEFVRNPSNPNWELRPIGRTDDVIVLATGEKVFPGPIETLLAERDDVKAAVAFGNDRFQLGVLVEPMSFLTSDMRTQFLLNIWPTIVEASRQMDNHARISSLQAVVILDPGVKFPRSDKGTVSRRETYQRFQNEISKAYQALEEPTTGDILHFSDKSSLENGIRRMVQGQLALDGGETLNLDGDLFESGMNSLQATNLRRSLHSAFKKAKGTENAAARVTHDFVYQHPTISKMVSQLMGVQDNQAGLESREDTLRNIIEKYSNLVPHESLNGQDQTVVLLTGSTGSLGVHLIEHLAARNDIKHIICLNRPTGQDPHERQRQAINAKGVHISAEAWAKVEVLASTIGAPFLGLPLVEYWRLCGQVTHIIHAAWPMDFKRTVSSFEVQFQQLSHLLELARNVHLSQPHIIPKFQFVSSISVVGKYPEVFDQRTVPEIPMQDGRSTLLFGYGEAKFVCEKMIEKASSSPQLNAIIVRVGQMSGAQATGYWNFQEHFPALVKSSKKIGALPVLGGTTSWLPVDYAAAILSDLLFSPQDQTRLVYHLENPIRQPWHDIVVTIAQQLGLGQAPLLSFHEWIERVRAVPEDEDAENPCKALLGFFESDFERMDCGGVVLDTAATQAISSTMLNMDIVSEELVVSYVRNWKVTGFLK